MSYGYSRGSKSSVLMHRFILDAEKGTLIDHLNGDKLDNRKINLRYVTRSQNSQNVKSRIGKTSKFTGVCSHRDSWICQIKLNNVYESKSFKEETHAAF